MTMGNIGASNTADSWQVLIKNSVGGHPSPTKWLALLSPKEAAAEYRLKSRPSPLSRAKNAKQMRRFHRAELGREADRGMREIRSLTAASSEEYFNAAFVRTAAAKEPIRLHGPESFLMTYSAGSGLGASLVVARVDTTAKNAVARRHGHRPLQVVASHAGHAVRGLHRHAATRPCQGVRADPCGS